MARVSPAREIALDVLERVRAGQYVEHALSELLERERISREDRALATELAYGTVRWRSRLDAVIDRLTASSGKRVKPTIREILRIALYQLILLDRIPPYAAVNEAVVYARSRFGSRPAGFINAVLRNALRNLPAVDPPPSDMASSSVFFSHPEWLVERWFDEYGPEETRRILTHNNSGTTTDLRVNRLKSTMEEVMEIFQRRDIRPQMVPYAPDALRLSAGAGSIQSFPEYEKGFFTIQDTASQMIAPLLAPIRGDRILDACAAPGGKSAHLAALTGNQIRLTVMDANAVRLKETRANLQRLGVTVESFVQGDAEDPHCLQKLGEFDRILLDPPCTGLGVLRHNPETKYRLTSKDPAASARRQSRMVRAVASALKPGGTLVYSVCTVLSEETRDVVEGFINEYNEFKFVPIDDTEFVSRGLVGSSGYFSTFPPPLGEPMDGFFAARIRRLS